MKSSYDVENEIKEKFGNNFLDVMKNKKDEFERLQRELEESKTFEEKVNNKVNTLGKSFIYISDDHTIYPDEICSRYLYQLARECIEENLSKKEEETLKKEYELKVIEELEDDIKEL